MPSTKGVEQTPCCGQSFTRPEGSLSVTICQRNWPSLARKAMTTPLSPFSFGLRTASLLVPMKTLPSATTGPA